MPGCPGSVTWTCPVQWGRGPARDWLPCRGSISILKKFAGGTIIAVPRSVARIDTVTSIYGADNLFLGVASTAKNQTRRLGSGTSRGRTVLPVPTVAGQRLETHFRLWVKFVEHAPYVLPSCLGRMPIRAALRCGRD